MRFSEAESLILHTLNQCHDLFEVVKLSKALLLVEPSQTFSTDNKTVFALFSTEAAAALKRM